MKRCEFITIRAKGASPQQIGGGKCLNVRYSSESRHECPHCFKRRRMRMSALPPKADMFEHHHDVRFVPKADTFASHHLNRKRSNLLSKLNTMARRHA